MKQISAHLVYLTKDHAEVLVTRRRYNREVHGPADPRFAQVEAEQALNVRASTAAAALPDLVDALTAAVQGCPCTLRQRDSGHLVDCFAPAAIAALEKAGAR